MRGKLIALNIYIRKEEKSKINDLRFYLKTPEIEEQRKREFDTSCSH